MRIGWAWWSLFFCSPSTPPLPHRHPQSIKLCSLQIFIVLILRATFCGGFWNFLQLTTELEGDWNYEKATEKVLLFLFLLILVLVANVLQGRQFWDSWLKLGQVGSNLPQLPLVLGLPYVVCQGVKSSFKLQWKQISICAYSEAEEKG